MSEERTQTVRLTLTKDYQFATSFESLPGAPAIQLDEPPPLGAGEGPNAAALLSAAVGNCLAASLVFCLKKSRVDVAGLDVDVKTRIVRNEAGRYRIGGISVTLKPAIGDGEPAKFARCLELFEDFCIVTASVRSGIAIDVAVERPQHPQD
ncbi:MAG: OsmC family protein [Acidobacteriota bacterium]